jgi:hypothetical protein
MKQEEIERINLEPKIMKKSKSVGRIKEIRRMRNKLKSISIAEGKKQTILSIYMNTNDIEKSGLKRRKEL